jgi:hypothetical protein
VSCADDPDFPCQFKVQKDIDEIIGMANKTIKAERLQAISMHDIENSFHKMCFGGDIHGVYRCTPVDTLHAVLLGLFHYMIQGFTNMLSAKNKGILDNTVQAFSCCLRQTGRRFFDRTDFTNGITNISLSTANERGGSLLILALLLTSRGGRDILLKGVLESRRYAKGEPDRESSCIKGIQKFRFAFFFLLSFNEWTKKDSYWEKETTKRQEKAEKAAKCAVSHMLRACKEAYDRGGDMSLKKGNGRKKKKVETEVPKKRGRDDINDNANDESDVEDVVRGDEDREEEEEEELTDDAQKKKPRNNTLGWALSKFHEPLHLPSDITRFGPPENWNTSTGERHHKERCKKPSVTAQKRHDVFTMQAANRLFESLVVTEGLQLMILQCPSVSACMDLSLLRTLAPDELEDVAPTSPSSPLGSDDESETNLYSISGSTFVVNVNEPFFRLLSSGKIGRSYTDVPDGLLEFVRKKFYKADGGMKYANFRMKSEAEIGPEGKPEKFRGHFDHNSNGAWHDWVTAQFCSRQSKTRYKAPARIMVFVSYTCTEGLFHQQAIVQAGERPANQKDGVITKFPFSRQFRLHSKRVKQQNNTGHSNPSSLVPMYFLVDLEAIDGLIFVFPDKFVVPKVPSTHEYSRELFEYHQLEFPDVWSEKFVTFNDKVTLG